MPNNNNVSRTLTVGDQVHGIEIRPEAHDPATFPPPPPAAQRPSISVNAHQVNPIPTPPLSRLEQLLLTLFAPDSPAGGIEYWVAHAACGVISGNRWNGWFTTAVDGQALTLTYGDILCERDYYFHLHESSLEAPYAIVPTFKEWAFPHGTSTLAGKQSRPHTLGPKQIRSTLISQRSSI